MLLACALPPDRVSADEPEAVIVTARRLEEKNADVPLVVHTFSAAQISAGSIQGLRSLSSHTPGLSFEAIWGGWNSFPVLRGQSQPSVAGDATGMFVDGVYQANRNAVDVEPLDLDRIEVVEGPQSALFGHSTFAGLINYVPARPTEAPFVSASADLGTDDLYGVRGTISGPVSGLLKGRLAAGWRMAGGTWRNGAAPDQRLGDVQRLALAGTLATREGKGPLGVQLSVRFGDDRFGMAPSSGLDRLSFNCGGRDPASGAWSYFCGAAPLPDHVSLSPRSPDSRTRTGQVALHLALDLGGAEWRSDTSYYNAIASSIRDLDGSADGDLFGVCVVGVNCTGVGSLLIPVVRLQRANEILRRTLAVREVSQEWRLSSTGGGRLGWQFGGVAFWTRTHTLQSVGAERGALTADERFSSLVLGVPTRVGPPPAIDNALTNDPNANQFDQNDFTEFRRTLAVFGAAEYRLGRRLRLRGELRANSERLVLDSQLSQFVPSFGRSIGARTFFDLTPRFSLDYRPDEGWLAYVSEARGSRSGGINPAPNLLAEEQTFQPETNWTTEVGFKYVGQGLIRSLRAAGYHIDWSNTQILGLPITPGVGVLVIHNTRGIVTSGIELAGKLSPAPWLGLEASFNYSRPRYKPGSEDAGSSDICGLSLSATSSFCRIAPSQINPNRLVPDISGNRPSRAAETSWAAGMTLAPQSFAFRGARLRIDVSHQGDVFEREADGLYYGARTLLSARITFPFGKATAELWGTNLTDDRYVAAAAPRAPAFYIGQPRPVDLILAEGRRLGVTLRYAN
jgi:iron complex outermembrane receptor protein